MLTQANSPQDDNAKQQKNVRKLLYQTIFNSSVKGSSKNKGVINRKSKATFWLLLSLSHKIRAKFHSKRRTRECGNKWYDITTGEKWLTRPKMLHCHIRMSRECHSNSSATSMWSSSHANAASQIAALPWSKRKIDAEEAGLCFRLRKYFVVTHRLASCVVFSLPRGAEIYIRCRNLGAVSYTASPETLVSRPRVKIK